MEHSIISQFFHNAGYAIDKEKIAALNLYAEMVFKANKSIGLSGHKNHDLIVEDLIINSLNPLRSINVPRGTLFGDLGTGSGIPGIPIAIVFDSIKGILFDSNSKKIEFVNSVIQDLGLHNVETCCGRIEEFGHDAMHRGRYDLLFSRAFNEIYVTFELAAPLLKKDGMLYVYSSNTYDNLSDGVRKHAELLGFDVADEELSLNRISDGKGILLKKSRAIDDRYPRRFAVIQREAKKALQ